MKVRRVFGCLSALLTLSVFSATASAQPCVVPDNGGGTVSLPPAGCNYLSPSDVHEIINGLPPGTKIELGPQHRDFTNITQTPGGPLGGETEQFNSFLLFQLTGTGELAGYIRTVAIPNVQVITHTAPRGSGTVQSFDTDMFMLQGQLPPGDPDFDLLRITAGTGFGMPSPGHTTLTQLPGGNWNVDSFFDITYRIDFVGRPGGPIGGMSGSTTATIRMQTGQPIGGVPCCLPNAACQVMSASQCAGAGGAPVPQCQSDGKCIPAGNDCFVTPCGRTLKDFCNDPIPAGFFDPGSEPFDGTVLLGSPPGSSTVVRRTQPLALDPGQAGTVPIEMLQLNLTSCQPIQVHYDSGLVELWDVQVSTVLPPAPGGGMTITKTHANGGTWDSILPVRPRFTFTRGLQVRVLDGPVLMLDTVGSSGWVHQVSPSIPGIPCNSAGANFTPGIEEDPATLEQCCTETCHANPGGGHEHCTKRCFTCPRGACCVPGNSCMITNGAAACPGIYMGDGTNCNDSDGDGLADVFERNDCCQPSGPCAIASSPINPDTDGDGVLDGDEVAQGCDPCVPDCGGGSAACCLPLGGCDPAMTVVECQDAGGTPLPAGTTCMGDNNQDGIDDACFAPPCVQCGPGDHWIDQTPCPPGDPASPGVCKLGGVNCLTNADCTGQCRLNPGMNCLTDADCTGHCEANPGQNCLVDSDCGGICTVSGVNCATNADCTAAGDVCWGNRCLGRKCDNRICNKFNSVGQDTVPSGAVLGIDTNFDCIADTNIIAGGPVTIRKRGPYDDSPTYPGLRSFDNHKDVVDTEILAMSLTGGGVTLRAGTYSGSNQPLQPTRGAVAELQTNPSLADSFFDVFFEIQLGPGSFGYNWTPVRVSQIIDCMPPQRNYFHIGGCIPLYATPNPVPGQLPIANLVQANHYTYPACCLPAPPGACVPNVSVEKCRQMGGSPVPACLGDSNGNGQDDACEQQCERDASSPTGCTEFCPPGSPPGYQCLPNKGGCDPNNPGSCGVLECRCKDPNVCRLQYGPAGPFCTGGCPVPPGGTCTLLGDGSFGNPYHCECETPPSVCEPNADGTECNDVQCPGPVPPIKKCNKKCGKIDAAGNVVLTDCECDGVDNCHMTTLTSGNVAGGPNGCIVPDSGGTVNLPPAGCDYLSPDDVHVILDGLPPGTTIEFAPIHTDFICRGQQTGGNVCTPPLSATCDQPGGTLGGERECSESTLRLHGQCVGPCPGGLSGWTRTINLPLTFETHTGPRNPGDPVQSFDTDMFRLQGQLPPGDPDFDLLRITAGTGFGMPSPGHTTLTQLPGGNWAVDSFFDITYRIDFVGHPGGPFSGMSGSTTGTIRMSTLAPFSCKGICPDGSSNCKVTSVPLPDGTKKVCCDCMDSDPTGACCTFNAVGNVCINTTQSQCNGTFLPGVTCSGITVPCCLPSGACMEMDEVCCSAAGGISGMPGGTCSPPRACCFQNGTCQNLDPFCCTAQGGTPQAAGSSCLGDLNGNGKDDACEPSNVCEPNAAGTACNPVVCPPVGGATETCQKRCAKYNPMTGQLVLTQCDCRGTQECHLEGVGLGNVAGGPNGCIVPDNGGGTVTLPPDGCDYLSPNDVHMIIDGLPPGTTIQLAPIHKDFICRKGGQQTVCSFPPGVDCEDSGGSLGGEKECRNSTLQLQGQCVGTCPGGLAGWMRTIQLPVSFETHTAPRTPGQPVQSFDTEMFRLFGQLPPGDPDFDLLRVVGGTDFGLPSPGHTTLTQLPGGNWAVDSFFDITYRIDFVGHPGGPFGGMSGSTTGTIRMATQAPFKCVGGCPPKRTCLQRTSINPDGTLNVCCDCRPKTPIADPTGINKSRFLSMSLGSSVTASGGESDAAIRVLLKSLHHVSPPYTGGPSIPFKAFEGQVRWVGPPAVYVESESSGTPFYASKLQCTPHYRDWTTISLLHVTGSAIVPSSIYEAEVVASSCKGVEAGCEDVSDPLELRTTRWGDVVPPFNPPSMTVQPDFSDISSLVDKFKNLLGAPIKARALLIGSNPDGDINIVPDLGFTHITACVDAFKGLPYPHTISSCP